MQIPTALQSNPSHLFKHIRFATYGGEPKEAHGIPTFATYGGEGSEHHMVAKVSNLSHTYFIVTDIHI